MDGKGRGRKKGLVGKGRRERKEGGREEGRKRKKRRKGGREGRVRSLNVPPAPQAEAGWQCQY